MDSINHLIFEKPSCKFKFLAKEGFNIPNFYEVESTDDILRIYNVYIAEERDNLNYEIDGLVEEINDFDIQKSVGYEPNGLNPKFAMAIKFDSVSAITNIRDIRWTVGTTGKIIPTAIMKPVEIMGVTIERATMHNYEYLLSYINAGLTIDSEVIVARKGDVIPQIIGLKTRDAGDVIFVPENCPVCNNRLEKISVDLVCTNPTCNAKVKGLLLNYFHTLDIKGVSDKFIEKAMERYGIKSIKDLLTLTIDDIRSLDGFAEKSAEKAYKAIHSVKKVTPEQFMALLSIPNQGVRVFENLFSSIPLEELISDDFTPEKIIDVKGFAEKSAKALFKGIQDNIEIIKENLEFFTIIKKDESTHSNKLAGKSFCITGKLNEGSRSEYEEKIISLGGIISNVSKKLDYLVTNEPNSTSSKMTKTIKINNEFELSGHDKKIMIIDEKQLKSILGDSDD